MLLLCLLFLYVGSSFNCLKADEVIDSLLSDLELVSHDSVKVNKYLSIAKVFRKNNLAEAIEYANKAMELAFLQGDSLHYAEALFLSGTCYSELGLYENALDRLQKAYDIFDAMDESLKMILVNINLGNVFWFQHDFEMALNLYHDGLKLSQDNDDYKLYVYKMNIALCYSDIGKLDSTIIIFDQMKLVVDSLGSYGKALAYLNFGSIYMQNHMYDSAFLYLNSAQHDQEFLPIVVKCSLKASQAQCYSRVGKSDLANMYLDSCKQLAFQEDSYFGLKEYYLTKFEIDTTLENYDQAVKSHMELMRVNDTLFQRDQAHMLANYNAFYNLSIKEREIEDLKKSNELSEMKSAKNQLLLMTMLLVAILLSILVILFIRLNRTKIKSILVLNDLNEKLESQKLQLTEKNIIQEQTLLDLKETQSQLVQSEKLASLGILASGIAHEINNPLNYINGGLILMDEIKDAVFDSSEAQAQYNQSHKMISDGVVKASNVVKALSSYAFVKGSNSEAADINVLIKESVELVRFKLKDGASIVFDLGDLPLISCDHEMIRTIFIQLLSNAIDAVKRCKKTNDKLVRVNSCVEKLAGKKNVKISIRNTGDKVDRKIKDRIFDPFFTTKDPDKGYGLGLSIAYRLVSEMNGNIVMNNIEDGVEFVVMFPIQ